MLTPHDLNQTHIDTLNNLHRVSNAWLDATSHVIQLWMSDTREWVSQASEAPAASLLKPLEASSRLWDTLGKLQETQISVLEQQGHAFDTLILKGLARAGSFSPAEWLAPLLAAGQAVQITDHWVSDAADQLAGVARTLETGAN